MGNDTVADIHNEILFNPKKKKTLPLVNTGTKLEDTLLTETSQAQSDQSCTISLMCAVQKKLNWYKQKAGWGFPGLAGGRNEETLVKGCKVSVTQGESFMGI